MRASVFMLVLAVAMAAGEARGQDASAEARSETRRSLAEYVFLGAQLGLRQRSVIYGEGGPDGPGGHGELRFYLNGRATTGADGPLAAYLGLGVVGRTRVGTNDQVGDPLLDPYDDWTVAQNVRLLGAHLEYAHHAEEGGPSFSVRAGRLPNLDGRSMLLIYDGGSARFAINDAIAISAFGGRRAILDRGFADDRSGTAAGLVAGGAIELSGEGWGVELGHQFEEIHRTQAVLSWSPSERLCLAFTAQALFGGEEVAAEQSKVAGILRADVDFSSASYETSGYGVLEAQLGTDPRSYGRGGQAPSLAEIESVRAIPIADARLDRLFFGPEPGHLHAEVGATQYILSFFGVSGGAFLRSPLSDDDLSSLRPRILELWLGPELSFDHGQRIAIEARIAFEDPGDVGRVFGNVGDGVRTRRSALLFLEEVIRIGDSWVLAVRPQGELSSFDARGPLSQTSGQVGYQVGGLVTLKSGADFRFGLRYAVGGVPDLYSENVSAVHDFEVVIGGAY